MNTLLLMLLSRLTARPNMTYSRKDHVSEDSVEEQCNNVKRDEGKIWPQVLTIIIARPNMKCSRKDHVSEDSVEEKCNNVKRDEGKIWPQVLTIIIVSLCSFSWGALFAWSSPYSLVLVHDKVNYDISEEDTSYFLLFQPLGMLFSSPLFFLLSDLLGRKKSVLFLSVPQILSWIITIFARNKWDFFASRFIAGIGDGVFFSSVPPYIGEITTPTVRGVFGNVPTFGLYLGQFLMIVIGSYLSVQNSAYIFGAVPVLQLILIAFLPESPYQLIKDGEMEQAKQKIKWLQRKIDVEEEFLRMKADVERQISESGTWKDLIKIPSNRRALVAGALLRVSQQFCGIATFVGYTQTIFEKAGGNVSPQHSSMIFIGLVCILNGCCAISVEKFGRTSSYFYSLSLSGTVLFGMSVYFFIDQYSFANLVQLNWFPLAGMILYVFTYSFGLGVVPNLMLGELFSASIKSKGLGVLVAAFAISILISSNLFHLLTRTIGLYSPFLMFALSCFGSAYLTLKLVPETKGKTLEEIQQSLKSLGKNN